ncbi:MAG: hypothetical protein WAV68_00715 [Candidatus Nanogingivalis sp.]
MEFISISKKHSLASSIAHIFLSILLVLVCWLSIYVTKTPFLAIVLILISKWRTFAVRPRYWIVNIKSNLVDLIFNLSMVLIIFYSGVEFWISQIVLVLLFVAWMTIIKPRSGAFWTKTQALLSIFFGLAGLMSVSFAWPTEIVAVVAFLIGYSSIRHILSDGEFANNEIISLIWGLIFAQFVWIANFLVIGYPLVLAGSFSLIIPQISIIATVLSFAVFEVLGEIRKEKIEKSNIYVPVIFSILICLILLIGFSHIPS